MTGTEEKYSVNVMKKGEERGNEIEKGGD